MLFLLAFLAFLATILGGLFALKFTDKLHLVLGFSAGAVIGVAFFDLLPEALELASGRVGIAEVTAVVALGFLIYLILDRTLFPHKHTDEEAHGHSHRGTLGAGSLSLHSLLDGLAIGLAFKVSPAVGLIVTVAVLAHDFSDGINTVSLILKNGGGKRLAFRWLLVDALAPVLGIVLTLFFSLSETSLGIVLAVFAGFFLYIGATDLLPESHHAHPTRWTTGMTVLGVVFLYGVIRLAGV